MNKDTIERMNMRRPGLLVLADGTTFEGELFGAGTHGAAPAASPPALSRGEVVFNTSMSGYQEIISDPSYAGQIITFTTSHIGNYGVNATDFESRRLFCRGVIVRDLARRPSNRRAEADLDAMLRHYGLAGIAGVDTRRLTRLLREQGSINGAFGPAEDDEALARAAAAEQGTAGIDLVAMVTTPEPYSVEGTGPFRVVAYDFGIKRTILRQLAQLGTVEVVPASTPAADVLARQPDGVFLSNGPGDPTEVPYAVAAIRELLGQVPVFGICLGHQLLGLALGAGTVKLPFGHHGGNHPVMDERTGRIEITSQNHNFAVDAGTLPPGVIASHVNLNDGVCEGLVVPELRAYSVQHHPEAGPGPHDSRYLFDEFVMMMAGERGTDAFVIGPPADSEPSGLPAAEAGVA